MPNEERAGCKPPTGAAACIALTFGEGYQRANYMLKILGRSSSINVRKVLWTCAQIGLAYEHEAWGAGDLNLKSPEFTALNPNGKVPVLVEDDLVLWESNAICRYLAAKHGRHDLLPVDPGQRGLVEQWMDWQATELNNAWRYAFMGLVRNSPAHADKQAIAVSEREWNRHMTMLDEALAKTGEYVTPYGFTLADIVLGLTAHRWYMTPIARDDLPAVAEWYERLRERAGFENHVDNGEA